MSDQISDVQIARAAAAISVVLGHVLQEAGRVPDAPVAVGWLVQHISFGVGVDVFFIVSGFIMALITEGRIGQKGYARYFAMSRLIRVVPLYWFYTSLMVAATLIVPQLLDTAHFDVRHMLASYLFIPYTPASTATGTAQPILALGWTLNYEMMFYAVFAAALVLVPIRRITLALAFALLSFAAIYSFVDLAGTPFAFWFRPIVLEFLSGLLLFRLYSNGFRIGSVTARVLMSVSIVGWIVLPNLPLGLNMIGWRWLLLGSPATLFLASLVLRKGPARRDTAARRILIRVGDASYTLYLAHPFILTIVFAIWSIGGLLDVTGVWGVIAAAMTGSLALSYLGYVWLERPVTDRLRARFVIRPEDPAIAV